MTSNTFDDQNVEPLLAGLYVWQVQSLNLAKTYKCSQEIFEMLPLPVSPKLNRSGLAGEELFQHGSPFLCGAENWKCASFRHFVDKDSGLKVEQFDLKNMSLEGR